MLHVAGPRQQRERLIRKSLPEDETCGLSSCKFLMVLFMFRLHHRSEKSASWNYVELRYQVGLACKSI